MARNRDHSGIRDEGIRWSVWYGCVLVAYSLSKEGAEAKLRKCLTDELDTANHEILEADDHRNYVVAELERIERDGVLVLPAICSKGREA